MEPRLVSPASLPRLAPIARVGFAVWVVTCALSACAPPTEPPPETAPDGEPRPAAASESIAFDPSIEPTSEGESYARSVADRVGELERASGVWSFGDASSDLAIWRENDRPLLIEETQQRTDGGHSTKRYFFRDGDLAYYREVTVVTDFSPRRGTPNPIAVERDEEIVTVDLAFGPNGDAIQARQVVDGVEEPLTEFVEPAVRRHAEELLEAAGDPGNAGN